MTRPKRPLPRLFLLLVLVSLLQALDGPRAFAHGGEDHGEAAPAVLAPGADGKRAVFAQSKDFELLLKYLPPAPGQKTSFTVFLADYATNAPVTGAKIELEFTGGVTTKAVAEPTGKAGIYHTLVQLDSAATHAVTATIEAGATIDLLEIKALDLTPAPAADLAPHSHAGVRVSVALVAGVAGGLVTLILLVTLGQRLVRRRSVRRAQAVALAMLLAGTPLVAQGHGGEDHGDPAPKAGAAATTTGGTYLAKESQFLLGVQTAVAGEVDLTARIETVGRVVPRVDGHAEIAAPQPGRIVMVGGKLPYIGDPVKRGQTLLVLEQTLGAADSGAVQAQAIQARSAAAQAKARRAQAERELARVQALVGVVANKDIERAQLDLDLAEKDVQRAQQEAGLYGGGGLRRIAITAPIDGVIAEADVAVGAQVAADRRLYTIVDARTLWVEADVFEADLGRIEGAGGANITVEGYPRIFAGTLFRLGQVVDPSTRTTKAIFAVDNADGSLRPGMFARIAIGAGGKAHTLAIPDAATIEDSGRRFVFVHTAPEEFARREVVLGARDGDFWAATAGIAKGERVVTQGTYQLRTSR